jgi:Regulator of chromosome condensation (RCC1) repeat/Repeat of unknown function (DUF5648)
LQCWGRNNRGQLGDGTITDRLTPIQAIAAGSGVTAVAAGVTHTCAVVNGGTVCFGAGSYGELGSNDAGFLQKVVVKLLGTPIGLTEQPVNRYRIFIPSSSGHLYTTDKNEYDVLIANSATYIAEGIDHKIFRNGVTLNSQAASPYYRLFIKPARQHFWTSDINEYNALRVQTELFIDEGIDGYIFLSPGVAISVPLYRLVLNDTAIHHWTTDKNEFDFLVSTGRWTPEGWPENPLGVTGYVMPK